MTFDEAFLSYLRGIQNNCLNNLLDINENNAEINEPQLIHRSSDYDIDKFHLLVNSITDKFSILSTNIQSINAKFYETEKIVELLNTTNLKFSIICLQEIWKSKNDDLSQFSLEGYGLIAQGKNCNNKGGLII